MPEVPASLPGQMEGQQLLAKNVLCVHAARCASEDRRNDEQTEENASL